MERKVDVITDLNGNKIVFINDIFFKGKRGINWKDVEDYLKRYVGEFYEIATGKQYRENKKSKHSVDAEFGWYRYESRFALPVYDSEGDLDHYNVFHAALIIRHAKDNKLYLYDIMAIKKETSNLFQS